MSILRDFEKRLEGAVEGFFAKAFRSGLQPVELAKAIQRYAANYQQVGVDAVFVPNVYRFTLAPDDLERFSGFTKSLQRELADVARRTADEKGWRTQGPIRIEFERSGAVRVGTYELRGKSQAPDAHAREAREPGNGREDGWGGAADRSGERASQPRAAPVSATVERLPTAAPSHGAVELRVLDGPDAGSRYTFERHALVGRLPECEVTLTDVSVSRRHARVQREGDRWTVTDLGSTNGVRINGASVTAAELRDGDRLELGSVRLVFALVPDGRP